MVLVYDVSSDVQVVEIDICRLVAVGYCSLRTIVSMGHVDGEI